MNDTQKVGSWRWPSNRITRQLSIRSMLVLTSMIAYLLCITLYYPDSIVTLLRVALSVFMIAGLSQQIRERRVGASSDIAPATSRRSILLLGLIGAILVLGLATTVSEWLTENRLALWGMEYAHAFYRGLSTTWTLAIFLSALTSPWMAYVSRLNKTGLRSSKATLYLVSLLCLCLLAITVIHNGLITALTIISCNGLLLGLTSPASVLAQIPIDPSNRLLDIQQSSMWLAGLWTIGVVGCLALLASLYWTSQNSKSCRYLNRFTTVILVICLAPMVWVIGWWTREVSPPLADSYELMPRIHWLTLLIPALLIAVYFVTRCPLWDHDATAPRSPEANDEQHSTTRHLDGQKPIETSWSVWSDSAWVGVLWIALPFEIYKEWFGCLPEIHTNPMRLLRVLEDAFDSEDSRLHLLLAMFGLQWMIRRIRWNGEFVPRWPYVNSTQWSMIPMAWLTVIMIILVSVPFGVTVWCL